MSTHPAASAHSVQGRQRRPSAVRRGGPTEPWPATTRGSVTMTERAGALIAGVGLADGGRASRWPARLDVVESASGVLLVLFMWAHMLFVSSILLGNEAMWTVTKLFEGYFFFGRSLYWIVSTVVAAIIALLVVHAALALRKFPIDYRQWRTFRAHMSMVRHEDTTLWFWQVFTGFALFFLASAHLYTM